MVRRPRFAARAIWVSGFWGTTFTSKGPVARWLMGSLLKAPSVGHRRQLIYERIFEPEVAQIPHPLRSAERRCRRRSPPAWCRPCHSPGRRARRQSSSQDSPPAAAAAPPSSARAAPPSPEAPSGAPRRSAAPGGVTGRSEEHTSELQSRLHLVCRLLLEKKKKIRITYHDLYASPCILLPRPRYYQC